MKCDNSNPWVKHYKLGSYNLCQTMRPYPKVPVYQFLDEVASRYPAKSAYFYRGKKITFNKLKLFINRLANALLDLGIKKGDKVVTSLPISPQLVIADLAIMKTGAIHVLCGLSPNNYELTKKIDEVGAEVVICLDTNVELVKSIIGQTKSVTIVVTALNDFSEHEPEMIERLGVLQLRDIISLAGPEPPRVEINPMEDIALIVFTGRGSGKSRGIMLTHYNLTSNTLQSLPWIFDPIDKKITKKSSILIATSMLPLFSHWAIRTALYWGLKMLSVSDPRDTTTILKILNEQHPSIAYLDPSQYQQLLEYKISRMDTIFTCGGLLPSLEVSKKFKKLTGMPIFEMYGYTETGPITHVNLYSLSEITGKMPLEKPGSIGVPVVDTEAKLIDSSKREVEYGGVGELYIRGPQVMKGYWPTTGDGLVDDWLPTGDICRMDKDGYFFLADHNKKMLDT